MPNTCRIFEMLQKNQLKSEFDLSNCNFEAEANVTSSTAQELKNTVAPKTESIVNLLASSSVPKRSNHVKGLIVSKPEDSPFDKFMNMLANLIKKFEQKFLAKLTQKNQPTITVKTPKPKKKHSHWTREDITEE